MAPRRRIGLISALLLSIIAVAPSRAGQRSPSPFPTTRPDVVFRGELAAGKTFERAIGHGLIFGLVPSPASFGNGWDIEIRPEGDPGRGSPEYASVATPPYHQYKPIYLNASYGVSAEQAVAMLRKFQFVETAEDSQTASVVVNTLVYTLDWTAQRQQIAAQAAKVPVGVGELRVVRSRIIRGKNAEDLGSIDWIKFQVRLWFDSGTTLRQVLFPTGAH